MNKLDLPLVNFYTFECDQHYINELTTVVETVDWTNNTHNKIFIFDKNIHLSKEFLNWIKQSLISFKSKIYPGCNADLEMTQIWANKAGKMSFHHKHTHPNSLVSGILYLNDDYTGGETVFYMDDPWYKLHNLKLLTLDKSENSFYSNCTIKPKAGTLVLFPSHISHTVMPVTSLGTRYTVAFNAFLKGKLGDVDSLTELNF